MEFSRWKPLSIKILFLILGIFGDVNPGKCEIGLEYNCQNQSILLLFLLLNHLLWLLKHEEEEMWKIETGVKKCISSDSYILTSSSVLQPAKLPYLHCPLRIGKKYDIFIGSSIHKSVLCRISCLCGNANSPQR